MAQCPVCNKPLLGRADKKFCSDACRFTYHNQLSAERKHYQKKVNAILKANRDYLAALCPQGKKKVPKARLIECDFHFGYHTGQYVTQRGGTYYYCYDYGYCVLDEHKVLVVKLQSYVERHLDQLVWEEEPRYGKKP